jgi:betaine/carnitine transporter, BCCT family
VGKHRSSRRDVPLSLISLSIIFLSVGGLAAFPKQSIAGAEQVLYWCTTIFASPVLLFAFGALLFVVGLAVSKYGRIRLGEGETDYSTLSWIFMFILSGL